MSELRYCRLCKKEETKEECAYGPSFWEKYSVKNLSKSVKDAAAAQSGIVSDKKEEFKGKTYKQFIEQSGFVGFGDKVPSAKSVGPDARGAANLKKWTNMSTSAKADSISKSNKNYAKGVSTEVSNARQQLKNVKLTPGSVRVRSFEEVQNEGAAWTKKEGQNSEGGLNEKGRKSYERENPGSDLKAPSKKVGNPRRASFCARMKGMRKRQKPSNNTGDDRLSKSLRKWNC